MHSRYKLLFPLAILLLLWYFSESISLTLNLNSFNVGFYPIYSMITWSDPSNRTTESAWTLNESTSVPHINTTGTDNLPSTTTTSSTTFFTNSSLPNTKSSSTDVNVKKNMLVTIGWAPSMGWGNLMFMYASMIGLSDVLKRTPVVDKNPIFPLLKIFQLNVTEVINHSWTGVGETCCCCYTPMEYSHMDPTKDYRINGYLQSFKYFSNFTERIRTQDFRFKENLRESVGRKQLELFNSYCPDYNRTKSSQNCTLIGVHVRRGDITSLNMQDYGFVVANRAYLLRAFDYFRQKLPDKQLIFTVIGNDYGWNLENLKNISETHMTVAILPTSASEFDLALLSSSDHFIMTTGTYGWWAGFLTGGIVVYHKVFARPGSYLASQMVGEDHFPPEWVPL